VKIDGKRGSHYPYESDGGGWEGLRRIRIVTNYCCYFLI
jgi:hypothetical protein